MTMHTDPKTNKTTYSDPEKVEAFGLKVATAMVDELNKNVEEESSPKKATQ